MSYRWSLHESNVSRLTKRSGIVAIATLDERMIELFRGAPDALARRIDDATRRGVVRLLESGPQK